MDNNNRQPHLECQLLYSLVELLPCKQEFWRAVRGTGIL